MILRLWAWEGPASWFRGGEKDQYYEPLPWARAGRELALDAKPKLDLDRFDEDDYKRLRSGVVAAGDASVRAGWCKDL